MLNAKTEEELLKAIHEIFVDGIPFNRVLGIDVVSLNHNCPEVRFAMRPDLVGNYSRGMLHGGVISSVHDLTGGLVAFLALQQKLKDRPLAERIERFNRIGTIDLRVDYLRAGKGTYFTATGSVLRKGNKVAVVRTEFCNEESVLIAAGTGTYLVG